MKETTPNDGDHTPSVGIAQAILSDESDERALFFSVGIGSKRGRSVLRTPAKKSRGWRDDFELLFRWTEFLPVRLVIVAAFAGSARQRRTTRPRLGAAPRYGARLPRQARLQIAGRRITK